MKNINTHVLEEVVKQNEDRSGHMSGCSIRCYGISCSTCPMNFNAHRTLQQVRDELSARTSTKAIEVAEGGIKGKPAEVILMDGIEGVTKPSHYALFDDIEAIEVIARSMTREQFKGFCLGNILKYRLRAGKKSELAYLEKDLAKASFYSELYEKHKGKCYE